MSNRAERVCVEGRKPSYWRMFGCCLFIELRVVDDKRTKWSFHYFKNSVFFADDLCLICINLQQTHKSNKNQSKRDNSILFIHLLGILLWTITFWYTTWFWSQVFGSVFPTNKIYVWSEKERCSDYKTISKQLCKNSLILLVHW